MIIFSQNFAIHKNGKGGKWRRGVFQVPSAISNEFGWKNQKVVVAVFKLNEKIDLEMVTEAFKKQQKIAKMEKELEAVKNSAMEGERNE